MEPDVIRIYSSSPPPMEDGVEEEDDEFGDFGTFSAVPNSISFTEFDTPTTFNQTQALTATSPPELINGRGAKGFGSSNDTCSSTNEHPKANGVMPMSRLDSCPSERTETKKVLFCSTDFSVSDTVGGELANCNGEGTVVLTNGFDVQGSPSSQNSVHSHVKETSTEDTGDIPVSSPVDDFADFAAFSDAEGNEGLNNPSGVSWLGETCCPDQHCNAEQGTSSEDIIRDTNRTGPNLSGSESISAPTEAPVAPEAPADPEAPVDPEALDLDSHTDVDSQERDVAFAQECSASEVTCTNEALSLKALPDESKDASGCIQNDLSPDATAESEVGHSDEKGSWNETETETETSLGRPLSTDALEEYGDISTTGSAPSPPLQGEPSTPADHSQLAEDDEDFGDFGDADSFGGQGFADFEQLDVQEVTNTDEDNDFGDFNSPKILCSENEQKVEGGFANFPVSDSFGNFSSAVEGADGEESAGWSAFGEQEQQVEEGESWAAFSTEESPVLPAESREEAENKEEEWHESDAVAVSEETSRMDSQTAPLSTRLLKVFESSFPQSTSAALVEDKVASLQILLEPPEDKHTGAEEETRSTCNRWVHGGVWTHLQDINEALGLRYQWGGSHGNKVLLCCLGIDTRNILFTGQKKQPVIVPMYAASLGMLEPTKEPVKPVSAAEMIASIAQTSAVPPEKSSCPSDSVQVTPQESYNKESLTSRSGQTQHYY